tara:strand:- start:218 stop:1156 length:939 start_codon:yes stop_codon:yes gene_type:complete
MNLNPRNQEKLFGYDNLFKHFIELFEYKKFPNKIIISGPKGIGKSTFAYHFINYIFSKKEKDSYNFTEQKIQNENRSFNLIKKLSHPNFYLIDILEGKKFIEIAQVRKVIDYSQKTSFDDNYKIVLIDNIEFLNLYSANALLKIIEEPNDKLLFILIHNNSKKIINTIKSRCIVFKKQFTYNENLSIASDLLNLDLKDYFNDNVINHYFTIGDFLYLYNFSTTNKIDIKKMSLKELILHLINFKIYKNNSDLTNLIFKLIESYFHYSFLNSKNLDIYKLYEYFIKKINYTNKFNLDIESLFLEFKDKITTNE